MLKIKEIREVTTPIIEGHDGQFATTMVRVEGHWYVLYQDGEMGSLAPKSNGETQDAYEAFKAGPKP